MLEDLIMSNSQPKEEQKRLNKYILVLLVHLKKYHKNSSEHFQFLPNSALPKNPTNRRRISTDIQRTQQIEKTSTLNDKSPALTVNGRF